MDGGWVCCQQTLTEIIQLNKTPYESQKTVVFYPYFLGSLVLNIFRYSERLNHPVLHKDAMLPTYTFQIVSYMPYLNGKVISQNIYQINQNH